MERFLAILTTFVACTSIAAAQTQSSSSATADPLAQERLERIRLLGSTVQESAAEKTFRELQNAYAKRRADHRASCRSDLRSANRDQKFSVLLRCVRGELTLERDLRLGQDTYLRQIPGVTAPIRTAALTALKGHTDAINAIVTAIDSGVYGTEDEVKEAKLKLEQKYRAPLSRSLTALRIDRTLSWIALLLANMPPENNAPRTCLAEQERVLRNMVKGSGSSLNPSLATTSSCLTTLLAPQSSSAPTP